MNIRAYPLAVLVVAGCVITSVAQAQTATENALRAIYVKAPQAFEKKDVGFFTALETPDFTSTSLDGHTLNRTQSDAMMKQGMAMMKQGHYDLKVERLTITGNNAVVMVRSIASGVVADPQGKPHKVSESTTERHSWVKSAKGWKIKRMEMLKDSTLVDGKPFHPQMPTH